MSDPCREAFEKTYGTGGSHDAWIVWRTAWNSRPVAESPKQTGAVGVERVDDDTVLVNGERFHATEKHGLVVTPEQAVKEYEPHARLMAECHYGAEHALLNRLIRMLAHLTTTQSAPSVPSVEEQALKLLKIIRNDPMLTFRVQHVWEIDALLTSRTEGK